MSLVFIKEKDKDCKLGMWEITEDYEELAKEVSLDDKERERLETFRNYARKLEFLSVRALLQIMIDSRARIVYNRTNKPYLRDNSYRISISHSGNYTAILLSRTKRVGVDMEKMTHRISRIAHYFINPDEKITPDEKKMRYHLYIHWCAKETLYKICDKNGLNFRKNLIICPFEPEDEGIIQGYVDNEMINKENYTMHYVRMDDYVLVWCCK
ncbi:MAG TPA: 4'-phosphopantetheinyl transferase superfamily protein [Bacteroidetes bacterium]|nr:4'-phosphopantetheinyl transferase superfamily protein [Bacteroidota bacterium]